MMYPPNTLHLNRACQNRQSIKSRQGTYNQPQSRKAALKLPASKAAVRQILKEELSK